MLKNKNKLIIKNDNRTNKRRTSSSIRLSSAWLSFRFQADAQKESDSSSYWSGPFYSFRISPEEGDLFTAILSSLHG